MAKNTTLELNWLFIEFPQWQGEEHSNISKLNRRDIDIVNSP